MSEKVKNSDIESTDQQNDSHNFTEVECKRRPQNKFRAVIFNLNVDCLTKLFDYLSWDDVHSFGQTCKPMEMIAGEYFQANYVTEAYADFRDVTYPGHGQSSQMHGFHKCIQNLLFSSVFPSRSLKKIAWYAAKNYHQKFKRLRFYEVDLTGAEIRNFAVKFEFVESVTIERCIVNRRFYEQFPKLCKNVRYLYVIDFDCRRNVLRRTGNEWLLSTYPKLLHLHWTQSNQWRPMNELKMFFQRNHEVRSFSTDIHTLWTNNHLLSECTISLDDLTIEMGRNEQEPGNIDHIYSLLQELHEHGIYKRLHIYLKYFNQQTINEMRPLNFLKSLCLDNNNGDRADLTLPKWLNLNELKVSFHCHLLNVDMLARQLVNLQRMFFQSLSLSDLIHFIRHSVYLTKVKVRYLDGNNHNNKSVLDLATLNKEREKLKGAKKMIIYIEEEVYLQTKWAINGEAFSLIEIRRVSSHEWGHHFIPFY